MSDNDYIVIIGSANMDVTGYSNVSLKYSDSNPGKIKYTPGGVGRNIAQNISLLKKPSWLLSVVGDDFHGHSLLMQTAQSGVHVDKCQIIHGEGTSSYLSLLDNTGEMLVAINDMSINEHITPVFLSQHHDFICNSAAIVVDCNISEVALSWLMKNTGLTPIFVDPVSTWKCVKISQHLGRIHTLKPNRIEAETLSGIVLSGTDDVARLADWFHQHGLQRLVLSMGADGVYYSEKDGERGWSAPLKTQVVNVTGAGDAMMAGLVCCWLDGFSFSQTVKFAQGCSSLALSSEFTNNPELSHARVKNLVENEYV